MQICSCVLCEWGLGIVALFCLQLCSGYRAATLIAGSKRSDRGGTPRLQAVGGLVILTSNCRGNKRGAQATLIPSRKEHLGHWSHLTQSNSGEKGMRDIPTLDGKFLSELLRKGHRNDFCTRIATNLSIWAKERQSPTLN